MGRAEVEYQCFGIPALRVGDMRAMGGVDVLIDEARMDDVHVTTLYSSTTTLNATRRCSRSLPRSIS